MKNNFYYFFSATPQVLSAILGLFGVFVIFKLQEIKAVLLSIAKDILQRAEIFPVKYNFRTEVGGIEFYDTLDASNLDRLIDNKNLKGISSILSLIKESSIDIKITHYNNIHSQYKLLISKTRFASILTAIVIIYCLFLLPFGEYPIKPNVLNILFIIATIGIASAFGLYVHILYVALDDKMNED